jgi:hypothetical protein
LNSIVFDIGHRDRVRDLVLDIASSDPRVVAGAVVGSLAYDEGDRWSDLDLMFAVADEVPVSEVLEAWTTTVVREFRAVQLFDLPSGPIIYRVFLLPHGLELICRSRERPTFARVVPSSECCSEWLSKSGTSCRPPHMSCLATPSTTPSTHALPSSEVGIGRRSIGSARYATAHSPSLVAASGSMAGTAGTSTDCLPISWSPSTMRSRARLNLMNSIVPFGSAMAALLRESTQAGEMADKVEGQLRELASGYTS